MKQSEKRTRTRFVATVLAVSFLFGSAATARAVETATPVLDPRPTLAASASSRVESMSNDALAALAVQGATAAPSSDSGGFFKSGKGKAALVMLIAATGFTVYSKYHDRVKSVIR